jgi:hypothetical protein
MDILPLLYRSSICVSTQEKEYNLSSLRLKALLGEQTSDNYLPAAALRQKS